MQHLLDGVIEALECGERVALLTAVRTVGSTPRHHAARLVVFAHREPLGTIGGGTMELQAIADARAALTANRSRLVEYSLNGSGPGDLGLCGGTQEVFIDILDGNPAAAPFRAVRAAQAKGEPVVVAESVRVQGVDLPGAHLVIHLAGDAVGSLGNMELDRAIVREARQVMAERYPRRLGFDPRTGAAKRLTPTRRAAVELFLDLYEPPPRLVIFGAGHIGVALAKQARLVGWQVEVVDDRPDYLSPQNLPGADLHLVAYDRETEGLGPLNVRMAPGTAVVVATWGWDQPALRQLAGTPAFYIGLVASMRKAAVIFAALREQGVDPAWLNSVRVPVGLDLGAERPEEIALAIMAEILAAARGKSGRPLREIRGDRAAAWSMPMVPVSGQIER
jgi:xanthine dehydrogenase accessory factor